MSTHQVRNIFNTQIDSVLVMAKNRIKEESKKKLNELKEQMPTPQEITKKLLVDINDNSCSDKGIEKFEKKYNKLYELVSKLSNTVGNILETITDIEETIKPIVEGTGHLGTITTIKDFLNEIDLVLIMSVHPGFGGQKFINGVVKKIEDLDKIRKEKKLNFKIEIDGGINFETSKVAINAGVDILVSGTTVFKENNGDLKKNIKILKQI